ncbi:MAG: tetratricopeptide repeat protein [Acidobacteriota bacterium]
MDSQHRKDLKTDKFVEEVNLSVSFLAHHKKQATQYGMIALAVLVVGLGYWMYTSRQATAREVALADAMHVADATVGTTPTPPSMNFATADLKEAAVVAAYTKVADQYKSSQEGAMANMFLAGMKAGKGQLDDAAKLYQTVIDSAPAAYGSLAKMALAQVYEGQNKSADAEKILRSVIDSPTVFVSKEEATLALGRLMVTSNPTEARKILEPLREARTAISREAIATLGELSR